MASTDLRTRRALTTAAIACSAGVFAVFVVLDRPGITIWHGYFVPIVLAALAWGLAGGAAAGLGAAALYVLGVWLSPHVPVEFPAELTASRLGSYLAVGLAVGYYAGRVRARLAQADEHARELRLLAGRDSVTGLPNQRAFERAANARIERDTPFVLVVCDIPPGPSAHDRTARVLDFAQRLSQAVVRDADVARIGDEQFAVLAPIAGEQDGVVVADEIERTLGGRGRRATAGWASFPRDGRDALGLYTAASERLYARKIARGEWVPSS